MKRLFTHSDLDGAGCAVLFKVMYPDGEITYCGSDNASDKIRSLLRSGEIPDVLFITDVSIDASMAEEIESLTAKGVQVTMHDHHETSLDLKGRKWANIDIRFCATALLFNSLRGANPRIKDYTDFVRLINIFDNYQVGQREFARAHRLNKICEYHREIASLTSFVERFLANPDCDPTPEEAPVIDYILFTDRKYINDAARRAQFLTTRDGVKKAVVTANRCINDIAQKILSDHPDIAFVEIVDMDRESVSVRARGKFNAAAYAEERGGGGHKEAAGYRLGIEVITTAL